MNKLFSCVIGFVLVFLSSAFDLDDLADLRELIIQEIEAETSGLVFGNPLVGLFDGLAPGDQPLIASLIRLAFHDCSGLNPSSTATQFNEYICDGCVKLDHPDHKGLYEGAIEPIEEICAVFYDSGLSRADCWALAATFAIEQAANNTLSNALRGAFGLNPTTVDILPGDIPYLIGRKDCDSSPDTAPDFDFEPFLATDGWDATSQGLKERFGLDSNQEVIALIGGGHSVGRGHARISGFNVGWDLTANVVDNDYFLTLINQQPVAQIVGLNLDWFQARVIDYDLPQLIPLNDGTITNRQFLVQIPVHLQSIIFGEFSPARPRDFKYLNSDISMAFDLRNFMGNGQENNITCHTDAYSVCGDKIVLIDGYEIDVNEEDEDNVCEYKQCPLQCPDENGGFQRFNDILQNDELDDIDANTDCIRALVQQFANDNALFSEIFIDAFAKMITTGYKNGNSHTNQLSVVQ